MTILCQHPSTTTTHLHTPSCFSYSFADQFQEKTERDLLLLFEDMQTELNLMQGKSSSNELDNLRSGNRFMSFGDLTAMESLDLTTRFSSTQSREQHGSNIDQQTSTSASANTSPQPIGHDIRIVPQVPVASNTTLLQNQESVLACLKPLLGKSSQQETPAAAGKRQRNTFDHYQAACADQSLHIPFQDHRVTSSSISALSPLSSSDIMLSGMPPPSKKQRTSWGKDAVSSAVAVVEKPPPAVQTNIDLTDHQAALWQTRYQELVEYRERHGHCLVPHKWAENMALSTWVKRQRYQYKLKEQGRRSTLTDDREATLNSLGFVFDSHNATWEERFQELVAFRRLYGHTSVPSTHTNHSLSVWVQCQRRQWKVLQERNDGEGDTPALRIKVNRIKRLNQLGFVWEPRKKPNPQS